MITWCIRHSHAQTRLGLGCRKLSPRPPSRRHRTRRPDSFQAWVETLSKKWCFPRATCRYVDIIRCEGRILKRYHEFSSPLRLICSFQAVWCPLKSYSCVVSKQGLHVHLFAFTKLMNQFKPHSGALLHVLACASSSQTGQHIGEYNLSVATPQWFPMRLYVFFVPTTTWAACRP